MRCQFSSLMIQALYDESMLMIQDLVHDLMMCWFEKNQDFMLTNVDSMQNLSLYIYIFTPNVNGQNNDTMLIIQNIDQIIQIIPTLFVQRFIQKKTIQILIQRHHF